MVGVLSDTHLPKRGRELPPVLLRSLENVDLILHAGDFTALSVLQRLQSIAPVKAVYGNVDNDEIVVLLAELEQFILEGLSIGLIHGFGSKGSTKSRALEAFPLAQCIVYGHSHIPGLEIKGNKLLFNPGSPTDKRAYPFASYGLLSIKPGVLNAQILRLPENEPFKHVSFMFSKTVPI